MGFSLTYLALVLNLWPVNTGVLASIWYMYLYFKSNKDYLYMIVDIRNCSYIYVNILNWNSLANSVKSATTYTMYYVLWFMHEYIDSNWIYYKFCKKWIPECILHVLVSNDYNKRDDYIECRQILWKGGQGFFQVLDISLCKLQTCIAYKF